MATPKATAKFPAGEIQLPAAVATTPGDVRVRAASIAIAVACPAGAAAVGDLVTYATLGVFEFPALTGVAFADFDQLYWDAAAQRMTNVSAGNTAAGKCVGAKGSAAAICTVDINR